MPRKPNTFLGKARDAKKLTQERVGMLYEVDASYIGRLETKQVGMTVEWARRFSDLYSIPIEKIWEHYPNEAVFMTEGRSGAAHIPDEKTMVDVFVLGRQIIRNSGINLEEEKQIKLFRKLLILAERERLETGDPHISYASAVMIFEDMYPEAVGTNDTLQSKLRALSPSKKADTQSNRPRGRRKSVS